MLGGSLLGLSFDTHCILGLSVDTHWIVDHAAICNGSPLSFDTHCIAKLVGICSGSEILSLEKQG